MTDNEIIIELLTEIRDSLKKPEKKKTVKFIKPTICDLRFYCDERTSKVDPKTFYDFYESKNWMVGRSKMKDWKAALRNWERRNETSGQRQNNGFDQRSRAQKVSDKLDEIARKDINENGFTSKLDSGAV